MSEKKEKSVFETLSEIDVKPFLEKKNKLDYLSWAKAWGLVKQAYPDATYSITEFPEYVLTKDGWQATGRNVDYRQTTAGYEVEAIVTIEGCDYSSKLFVMNLYNKAVKEATYFEINKTQQRALVKALAIAGLGLSVYAGEDLPDPEDSKTRSKQVRKTKQQTTARTQPIKKQMTDQQLLNYEITDDSGKVKLVQVVAEAVAGNEKSAATLHGLEGESKEAYAEIYKRKLHKNWLSSQAKEGA